MEKELLKHLFRYARDAGEVALSEQACAKAHLKSDNSYVTGVDLRLSELAMETFSEVVASEQIVTEERLDSLLRLRHSPREERSELLVVVDPIDGTRNFFHNMPLFGISVGVLRNLEPWLGVVVFPALDEVFYADSTGSYLITGFFKNNPETRKLEATEPELNANSVMLFANSFARRYQWSYDVCTMMLTACVTVNSCWPAIGRGIGTIFTDHIWDFAGSWPLLHHLGFELRGVYSGARMTRYRWEDYDPETYRTKEPVLVCRPQHFLQLKAGVSVR